MRNSPNLTRLSAPLAYLMTAGFLFLPVYSTAQLVEKRAAEKAWSCVKGRQIARDQKGKAIWLSTNDLEKRAKKKVTPQRPGTLGRNTLRGAVTLQILIEKDGTVQCIRAISGEPAAVPSAIEAIRDWVFEPYAIGSANYAVLGEISIQFDFRSGGPNSR